MPVSRMELQRAGALKRSLVSYVLSEEAREDLKPSASAYRAKHDLDGDPANNNLWADFLDTYIHTHVFPEGDTPIDRFVQSQPDLTEDDRAMVLAWKTGLLGVFAIARRTEDVLLTRNLIDELPYALRSNQQGGTRSFLPGMFLISRAVPLVTGAAATAPEYAEEWMLSGISMPVPAADPARAYQTALNLLTSDPQLAFRNPDLLERSAKMQVRQHELFVELFGSDAVVIAPEEYQKEAFRYHRHVAIATSKDASDTEGDPLGGATEEDIETPVWLDDVESVGLIYDPVAGPMTLPDYGMLVKAFAEPDLASESPYRDAVLEYIEEEDIPSTAFRRLAIADPAAAGKVMQLAYEDPDLTWEGDGERLLHDNRGRDDVPKQPTVITINERLLRYAMTEVVPEAPALRRIPGRNDPCPCGSGQKYKRCCGR